MNCMYAYFEYQGEGSLEQDVVHIETHAGFATSKIQSGWRTT